MTVPLVGLKTVPVVAPARSEAKNAAVFAAWATQDERRSTLIR
jgi:hypothetical protein